MDIMFFRTGWCWCRHNSDGRKGYFCDESSLTALLACMIIVVTINEFFLQFIVNRDNIAVISILFVCLFVCLFFVVSYWCEKRVKFNFEAAVSKTSNRKGRINSNVELMLSSRWHYSWKEGPLKWHSILNWLMAWTFVLTLTTHQKLLLQYSRS